MTHCAHGAQMLQMRSRLAALQGCGQRPSRTMKAPCVKPDLGPGTAETQNKEALWGLSGASLGPSCPSFYMGWALGTSYVMLGISGPCWAQ